MVDEKLTKLEKIASVCDDFSAGKKIARRYREKIKGVETETILKDLEKIKVKQGYLSACDLAEYLDSRQFISAGYGKTRGTKPSSEMYDQDRGMFG